MSWPSIFPGPITTELPGGWPDVRQSNTVNYVQGITRGAGPDVFSAFGSSNVGGVRGDRSPPYSGQIHLAASPTTDMRYRFYVVPVEIKLVNPPLNTDLVYELWNTFPENQTLNSIAISDPIITSDLQPPDTINAGVLFPAVYQIGSTNTDIDATITLTFDDEIVVVPLFGSIASTFTLIPDVPVTEDWQFLTEVIRAFDDTEQRIALRKNPRRSISFDVEVIDFRQRREQYITLFRNMGLAATVPQFMHGTRLTQDSPINTNQVFFDPELTQVQSGQPIVFLDPLTEVFEIGNVTVVNSDGATLAGNLSQSLDTNFVVFPAISYLLEMGSGITTQQVTGRMKVTGDSLSFPPLERDNAVVTIQEIGGLPIMDKRFIRNGLQENFSRRVEALDNETGLIKVEQFADPHSVVEGPKSWAFNRYDRTSEDYFRAFINRVRGAQKAFFLPTWMPDFELNAVPALGASQINVTNQDYETFFSQFPTWQYIMLQYKTLEPTFHQVTATEGELDGSLTLTISPSLAPGDENALNITMISFLNRVRGDDRIRRSHDITRTQYTWNTRTVDN